MLACQILNAVYMREQTAVKSAARTLDILGWLSEQRQSTSLADISRALRIPKSSALQLLRTLEGRQYVARDRATNRFRLGVRVLALGRAYAESVDLVREGQPVLVDLSRALDETCHLAVLAGLDGVYVAKEESGQPMRMVSAVGRRLPAHATGVGKMLLAMLDDAALLGRLRGMRLARLTPQTITSLARLREECRLTRERWFAFDREESTDGLRCIAAPVLDESGACLAAISASVPTVRLPADRVPEILGRVCDAARRLSRALGYRGAFGGALAADREQLHEWCRELPGPPARGSAALARL
jgi:IclR family transcriptional regulator, KDG regulon repressor